MQKKKFQSLFCFVFIGCTFARVLLCNASVPDGFEFVVMDNGWRAQVQDEVLATQQVVHHIERFKLLITKWLPSMIYEHAGIDTTFEENGKRYQYVVDVRNYRCARQQITPDEAHMRNMNYALDLLVDLHLRVYELGDVPDPKKRKTEPTEQPARRLVHEEKLEDHVLCGHVNMLHGAGCIMSDGCGLESRIQSEVGGSFILRGKRRFIPFMMRLHYNEPLFMRLKGKQFACEVRSEHLDRPHRSTSTMSVILQPAKRNKKVLGQGHQLYVSLPFLKPYVPMHILVLALGFRFEDFERAMYQMDMDPAYLRSLVSFYVHRMRHAHHGCTTREAALLHIAGLYKRYDSDEAKLRDSITKTLNSEVLPHLNFRHPNDQGATNTLKLRYIAWVSGLLYRFGEGQLLATDRDSYQYLVFDGASDLLAQLFRQKIVDYTKNGIKTLRRALKMKPKKPKKGEAPLAVPAVPIPVYERVQLDKVFNANRLTPKLMSAVSTGRWSEEKKGVSHPMKTGGHQVILSQLRRVSSSFLTNKGKHVDPRMLHETSFGLVCAAETPDGESCGLVCTLAMSAVVTPEGDADAMVLLLLECELKDLYVPLESVPLDAPVDLQWWKFIGPQGILFGWLRDGPEAVRRVRRLRRTLAIDPFTSVYLVADKRAVFIKTSAGRLARPLIVTENMHKIPDLIRERRRRGLPLMRALMQHGCVEYLDAAEAYSGFESVCVAFSCSDLEAFHTHMELSDNAFVGLCAATLPLFRHNQGPRLVYEIGMVKQYISPEASDDCGANNSHSLHYGQHPLVVTANERPESCEGINCVLAICTNPFAQEDALVVKKQAIDRGMFHSSTIRTHTATHTPRNPTQPQDVFERPDPTRTFGMKLGAYKHLRDDGMPRVGAKLGARDIVMGKTIPNTFVKNTKVKTPLEFSNPEYANYRRDASVQLRKDEAGTVYEVITAPGIRKVRILSVKDLYRGDKISNLHGQKGTVGCVMQQEDMPFVPNTGMIPDIICGPTSLPSRMTIGFLLEMLIGKAAAVSAQLELGVETREWTMESTERIIAKVGDVLHKYGFRRGGTEQLCDGLTGNMIQCEIMVGPVHYGKLDHMCAKKAHARARGPTQPVTRQPIEGRRNDGGFRLGNMEIDVLAAYGCARILKERTTEVSDEIDMYRCKQCGFAGDANPAIGLYMCRFCKTSKHMRKVKQSNSATVMFTELNAGGMSTRFILRDLPTQKRPGEPAEAPGAKRLKPDEDPPKKRQTKKARVESKK